jgi:hypothetical protein
MRDIGLSDLEDLRLPVTALRVGWFSGSHRLELTGVPETDFGYRSPPGGPYGSVPALLAENPIASTPLMAPLLEGREYAWAHQQDRFALEQLQGFARWRYSGPVDLGLYAATLYDKQGNIGLPGATELIEPGVIEIPLTHQRYSMVGHSGVYGVGDFLFRWETGLDIGRSFDVGDPYASPPETEVQKTELLNFMGGVQLAAIPRTTLDFEVAGGVYPSPPEDLLFPVNAVTYGFRGTHTALKERLRLNVSALGSGAKLEYGGLVRADASYEIRDGMRAMIGGIVYRPGKERGFLLGLDQHDQLFAQLRFNL